MREIKFRLRLDDKIFGYEKWYGGERAQDEHQPEGVLYWRAEPCWLYSMDGNYWNPSEIFHNKKDSFTGLKDKNGKEIYKGDIVQVSNLNIAENYVCKWSEEFASFEFEGKYKNRLDDWVECGLGGGSYDKIEVIGNIYENKELLKE